MGYQRKNPAPWVRTQYKEHKPLPEYLQKIKDWLADPNRKPVPEPKEQE